MISGELGKSSLNFGLETRRSSRFPLRVRLRVTYQEKGKAQSLDARTVIVNRNGCKIERERAFELHEEVLLEVPSTRKSGKGKVVWREPEANGDGNFECGVELEKAENLWAVRFPVSDWEAGRTKPPAKADEPPDF